MKPLSLFSGPLWCGPRGGLGAVALGLACMAWPTARAADPVVAVPAYTAAQALQGLYRHRLTPDAQAFAASGSALTQAAQRYCTSAAPGDIAPLRRQWQQSLQAWERLSTVSVGPLVTRRSQRQIDFWPTRPPLIAKAIQRAPRGADAMERVGTPAKGFPAREWLLWTQPVAPDTSACGFAIELTKDIEREAGALAQAFAQVPVPDDEDSDPKATGQAYAEWINQWLGGLERLRWAQMEKPVLAAQPGEAPAFARQASGNDLASWGTQWQVLRELGAMSAQERRTPTRPGEGAVSLEALLLAQGKMALAARWSGAVGQADRAMPALRAPLKPGDVQGASQSLKQLSLLFQNEIAGSLNVPLGFSDADGD